MSIAANADNADAIAGLRPQRVLDASGLHCPLPILKAKAELNKMRAGEVLHVHATDPLAPLDFKSWCVRAPHDLVGIVEAGERSEFYIKKGG
ncbi:MAG: sulfurtransferase TusA family protein [Gammaproteobacteria bacterium]|nr:sulfurtransferase TusA family protein [Gammaproteobacteria bacterium]MDD9799790.1 sulfurtransferase TusA family protein [Gammaproteobacteria bacterium]MDD9815905.1 sulfurtransferase TusA family protein [Gammaproteobacteria bacterium]MDD9852215.1 sulfurtransferase TusA family protein [Gammaproteobacteria bacterium]MDD9871099.1 sulfurtransferase TusA family protein [Gammaproteobacteria bacterium]